MPDSLNSKAIHVIELKMCYIQLRGEGIVPNPGEILHYALTGADTRQGHPLVVIEKESRELSEVIVTYRKELSCMNESDSRIFILICCRKSQETFVCRLNMKHTVAMFKAL